MGASRVPENIVKALSAVIPLTFALCPTAAFGFCGTYVGDGASTLQNRTSQIVLVRQADQTAEVVRQHRAPAEGHLHPPVELG